MTLTTLHVAKRSTWTTRANGAPARAVEPYLGVAVHWPGDSGKFLDKPHAECEAHLRAVENYQLSHGYSAIAYQAVACVHGLLIEGRTVARRNGANGEGVIPNSRYGSVLALLGAGEEPPPAMLAALRAAPAYLNTPLKLLTHNEVRPDATACPGPALTKWIKAGYPEPEDDMALSDDDVKRVADAVWDRKVANLVTPPTSQAETLLTNNHQRIVQILALVKQLAVNTLTPADLAAIDKIVDTSLADGVDVNVTVT